MLAYRSHRMMLPSRQQKAIGTSEMPVSQLNTQPMVSPVNASRQTSRAAAHHSGSGRLARPYPAKDFHLLSFASLSWRSLPLATLSPSDAGEATAAIPSAPEANVRRSAFSPVAPA
jgi:hypothetical protein